MTEPAPPTGPPNQGRSNRTLSYRIGGLALALTSLALLLVASGLHPDARGHGTHQQLGLPPCGWVAAFNLPCPTCGMTTAFARAAHGDPVRALAGQPLGALLAVVAAACVWAGVHAAVTGRDIARLCRPILGSRMLWLAGASLAASWVYKMVTWE